MQFWNSSHFSQKLGGRCANLKPTINVTRGQEGSQMKGKSTNRDEEKLILKNLRKIRLTLDELLLLEA